jgi:hypothetical protein
MGTFGFAAILGLSFVAVGLLNMLATVPSAPALFMQLNELDAVKIKEDPSVTDSNVNVRDGQGVQAESSRWGSDFKSNWTRQLPGPFLEGQLFLLSAQIIKEGKAYFFVLTGLDNRVFEEGKPGITRSLMMQPQPRWYTGSKRCLPADADRLLFNSEGKELNSTFLRRSDHPALFVKIPATGVRAQLTYISRVTGDGNVVDFISTWRSDITAALAGIDYDRLPDDTHTRVLLESGSPPSARVFADLAIPVWGGGIGSASALHISTSPLHRRHVGMTLVSVVFDDKGLVFVREYVRYHLQRGVGIVMLGVAEDVLKRAWNLLSEEMQAGSVVLIPIIDLCFLTMGKSGSTNRHGNVDLYKLIVWAAGLSLSKGLARYMGNWDLDEYIVPSSELVGLGLGNNLPALLDRLSTHAPASSAIVGGGFANTSTAAGDVCPSWCSVGIPTVKCINAPLAPSRNRTYSNIVSSAQSRNIFCGLKCSINNVICCTHTLSLIFQSVRRNLTLASL